MKVKVGVLKRGFEFRSVSGLRFKIPKGVRVVAIDGVVYFIVQDGDPTDQPIFAFKVNGRYYASLYGTIHLLEKFNPTVPYPLSLI